jgi:hypothetical protein
MTLPLDIAKARAELRQWSATEVQRRTAGAWASRAVAALGFWYETGPCSPEATKWLLAAGDYLHEALEHASLVGAELVEEVGRTVKGVRVLLVARAKRDDAANGAARTSGTRSGARRVVAPDEGEPGRAHEHFEWRIELPARMGPGGAELAETIELRGSLEEAESALHVAMRGMEAAEVGAKASLWLWDDDAGEWRQAL